MKSPGTSHKKKNWEQVFAFGESLFEQPSIEAQRFSIISMIEDWFACEVNCWLIEDGDGNINQAVRLGFKDIPEAKQPLVQQVFLQRKSLYRPQRGKKTQIISPLIYNSSILGFIDLDRSNGDPFTQSEIHLIEGVLKQSAFALHYSDLQRKSKQLESIIDISSMISSFLNLDEVLAKVVENIHKNLNFQYAFIFTVHPGRKKIILQSGRGDDVPPFEQESICIDLEDPQQAIAKVAQTGETESIIVNADGIIDHPLRNIIPPIRSELIIPIIVGGEVLGILDVIHDQSNGFSHDDIFLLETLADHVATAIRNATLYRSEQWRRKAAESVREVAGLLTADTDLEHVLDRILTELEHILPCDFAVIWLLDVNQNEDKSGLTELSLAAVHISWQPVNHNGEKEFFTPEEVIQICSETNLSSEWLQNALSMDFPSIRTSSSPYEPIGSILDFPEDYSSIAAPLRIAEHKLGILSLGHHTSGRYGNESQTMTATFASYAAVAIENTRLYEAAHDQAWISTVLLQVAEATQSLNSLDELLETMARITPMLIGVNACFIFLWESSVEAFLPFAYNGIDTTMNDEIKNLVFFAQGSPSWLQLIQTKAPVWLTPNDFEEESGFKPLEDFLINKNKAALIPMTVRGEIQGAFLIDFSDSYQLEENEDHQNQLEEKFSIIQGIAHQAALAVENIQLLKSQKEEAYVSIALLQVAQAVVSLNELEETLETIVRITPILVGVKRAVIFTWDEEQSVFRISQSYGISRTELMTLGKEWSSDEFPLLHTVRMQNAIVFHVFNEATESPTTWQIISSVDMSVIEDNIFHPDGSNGDDLNSQSSSTARSYLNIQSSLLYAYPLSVKGQFLGVMITQERENVDKFISAQSRSRRQEITIGITQQAALAIQNEKLQSEVVERERMERELQLAREIQQTFLPDHLPQHPGWDLDVLWKPAREVGGDFYDVFDLPGNRLGLVIADVADKGMPAALFMTLVRTLIRATAREEISPSSVLEIVNDLLVTDTKHGLFITVAYAVVSLDTGRVIFANAGHNLPLLIRQNKQLEILQTTGMALGVLEGIHIADLSTDLNQDDCLIFYTDGVTEAFSPEGEMFGEQKLREFVLSGECKTAQQQLEAIDQAVQEFIGDLPYSDDITILTVRRTAT
jgi:phosphoserine phosphatase RsbU/P